MSVLFRFGIHRCYLLKIFLIVIIFTLIQLSSLAEGIEATISPMIIPELTESIVEDVSDGIKVWKERRQA